MNLAILESHPPISKKALRDFERRIGCHVPRVLREFLLNHDGAETDAVKTTLYPTFCACPFRSIPLARILGIQGRDPRVLTIEQTLEEFDHLIPRNSIPFAQDAFGSFLSVDLDSEQVDYVNIEEAGNGTPATWFRTGLVIADVIESAGQFSTILQRAQSPAKRRILALRVKRRLMGTD